MSVVLIVAVSFFELMLSVETLSLKFDTKLRDDIYVKKDYTYVVKANSGMWKLHIIPEPWDNARLRCFFEGGILASPLNSQILITMRSLIGERVDKIFTGISATYSPGDFYSVEGVSIDNIFAPWAPGQPSNSGNENCVALASTGFFSLESCLEPLPFICFKKRATLNECGTIDPEYKLDKRTGHCYKFHRFGQSWSKAFMACSAEGGHLAVINSEVEAQVLRETMAKYPAFMIQAKWKDFIGIGFRDWSQHGIFMTVEGQTLAEAGYSKWAGGQPDNSTTGEYCGSMFRDARLNDIWCEDTIPFICERLPLP